MTLENKLPRKAEQKIVAMLGFAHKAGASCSGNTAVEAAIKYRKAKLLVIANDAADSTSNKYKRLCEENNLPVIVFGAKSELGAAIGKAERSVVAICNNNFSSVVLKWYEGNPEVYQ